MLDGETVNRFVMDLPPGLHAEDLGEIAVLWLNRPGKSNALDDETVTGLDAFFAGLPASIKAVVLAGRGKHFSAGLDLTAVEELSMQEAIAHSRGWHKIFERIEFGRVPVISVLHGAVVGGGLELAAATHVRVAERSAYYALPEGQRGIFVGGGGSVRLPRLIGTSRMMEMMLTGRTYGAEEGMPLGFSHYVTADGQGLAKGIELARKIASNSALTNYAVLQVLPRIAEAGTAPGYMFESLMASIAQSDGEAKARKRDFLEKRAAKTVHNGPSHSDGDGNTSE
jgi:enoyl-CoA hydratase/carnithine racemase